jgi:hypothetical protein
VLPDTVVPQAAGPLPARIGRSAALVHLPQGGRSGANSEPLCDDPPETDRFRTPGRQHPIKDRQADGSLCLLRGETACAQPRPDQHLVAAHRRFDERALVIAGGGLPGKSPSFRDHFQMVITLCRLIPFAAGHRRRARWSHHIDVIVLRRDRLVSGVTITRTIRRHSGNPVFNLTQQRRHLGWIVGVLIRQSPRHDHAADSIDHQMQFTPFLTRLRVMLRGVSRGWGFMPR